MYECIFEDKGLYGRPKQVQKKANETSSWKGWWYIQCICEGTDIKRREGAQPWNTSQRQHQNREREREREGCSVNIPRRGATNEGKMVARLERDVYISLKESKKAETNPTNNSHNWQ
jgi:hypothetical protein